MFSSGEYTNAYASPSSEYTHLNTYYKGSQFGPKLPASVPSNGYPTILKQGNEYGYEALTHDTDGNSYYNVEKAYGNNCQPKYYVAKCPENKFIRPFVPDGNTSMNGPPTPCPVKTQPIAEGYMYELPYNMSSSLMSKELGGVPTTGPTEMYQMPSPTPTSTPQSLATEIQNLKVIFFYDKKCPHSLQAMQMYQKELAPTTLDQAFLSVKDISLFNNEQLLTELGGTATPFFYSQATHRSVTGFVAGLHNLMQGLNGKSVKESYQPTSSSMEEVVKKLNVVVFVMQGCGYCDKLKALITQAGLQNVVKFVDARDPNFRHELMNVRGFPYYKSMTTGKSSMGYPGSLQKMLAHLE